MGLAISTVAAALLLALSAHTIYRGRSAAGAALSVSVLLLALIEALDRASLSGSFYPYELKRAAVFLEALLPASLLLFSVTYSRNNARAAVPLYCKALLAASLLFPAAVLYYPLASFFYSPDLQTEGMLFLGRVGYC